MPNHKISIDALRNSFNSVYDGPDRLQREYEMAMEAERLGVHIDTYRRLYELRKEEKSTLTPNRKNGGTPLVSGENGYGTCHSIKRRRWFGKGRSR